MLFRQLNPGKGCKTYLLGADGSKDVALVDPVLDRLDEYLRLLEADGLRLTHVMDTHTHADHLSAGKALREQLSSEYVMHRAAPAECVTIRVGDGEEFGLGSVRVKGLATPGHTKDSVSLLVEDRLLTGDALFLEQGGAGRLDLPGGDASEHWDSLERIRALPGSLVIHPGHEYRGCSASNLNYQRVSNPFLKPTSRDGYLRFLEGLSLGPAEWMTNVLRANYACEMRPGSVDIPKDVAACEVQVPLPRPAAAPAVPTHVVSLSAVELRDRLAGPNSPLLVDVREAYELAQAGKIAGILHVPLQSLPQRLAELEPGRTRGIVAICHVGSRSYSAAEFLLQSGFPRVWNLSGGMVAWLRARLPTA